MPRAQEDQREALVPKDQLEPGERRGLHAEGALLDRKENQDTQARMDFRADQAFPEEQEGRATADSEVLMVDLDQPEKPDLPDTQGGRESQDQWVPQVHQDRIPSALDQWGQAELQAKTAGRAQWVTKETAV